MKLLSLLALALSVGVSAASADPIEERQEIMKERGGLLRILAPVAQERQPFDAATVLDALERLSANAEASTDLDTLWPEGSQEGSDSAATVWSDREGYQAASDKFAQDVAAAVAAAPQDLAAFQAVFAPVAANCGACHEVYRD